MPGDSLGHYRHLFEYDLLYTAWKTAGKPDTTLSVTTLEYQYGLHVPWEEDTPHFLLPHGYLFLDRALPVVDRNTNVALVETGTGTSKTSSVAVAAPIYCALFPDYNFLNAAPITFTAQPNPLVLMVDSSQNTDMSLPLTMHGPYHLDWTATENISWLALSTARGSIMTPPTVTVINNALTPGWQTGQIEFSASSSDGLAFTQSVPVSAYYGPVRRTLLPVVMH